MITWHEEIEKSPLTGGVKTALKTVFKTTVVVFDLREHRVVAQFPLNLNSKTLEASKSVQIALENPSDKSMMEESR